MGLALAVAAASLPRAAQAFLGRSSWATAQQRPPPSLVRRPVTIEQLFESPGRFSRDEVPDDGLQKWVAWCEMVGDDDTIAALQQKRAGLVAEHSAWER